MLTHDDIYDIQQGAIDLIASSGVALSFVGSDEFIRFIKLCWAKSTGDCNGVDKVPLSRHGFKLLLPVKAYIDIKKLTLTKITYID